MKKIIGLYLFLLVINLAIPVMYYKVYSQLPVKQTESDSVPATAEKEYITIYDKSTDSFLELGLEEYLISAAACEMPALYEENAIKAQMVAIHSYYMYCKENPDSLDKGYIEVDEKNMKGYASQARLMEFWQMDYYDYYAKFQRCAKEVADEIITYKGKPAMAVYHAVSCGKTADSEEVWGQAVPYLVSVDSSADQISDSYLKIKEFSKDTMYSLLRINYPNIPLEEEKPEEWFGDIIYTESGYASYVYVGKDMVPASQIRDVMGLQSTCMMIFYEDDLFSVATKGYGHGVGLSQFGANQMSSQGKDYKEILQHYYPETKLETI